MKTAIDKYCEPTIPRDVVYFVSGFTPLDLRDENELLEIILHKDGRFRPSIRLSPFATTDAVTVIEVSWGDDTMDIDKWTDFQQPPGLQVKYEPFFPTSPSLNDLTEKEIEEVAVGTLRRRIILPKWPTGKNGN